MIEYSYAGAYWVNLSVRNALRRVSEWFKQSKDWYISEGLLVVDKARHQRPLDTPVGDRNTATMTDKENGRVASKDLGRATATDIASATDGDANHELHFVRRGESLAEASSSQESIDGYDPDLMSGRTLLTVEEERKLLRKIDWRLMTLCSLIFMFKNLDSNNVGGHIRFLMMVRSNLKFYRHRMLVS